LSFLLALLSLADQAAPKRCGFWLDSQNGPEYGQELNDAQLAMHLVIFDIDGTLTETTKADGECFVQSLAEVCGFKNVDADWSHYKHATDAGLLKELYEVRTGRLPSADEVSQVCRRFVELLTQTSSRSAFRPVAGAPQLLARLDNSKAHGVCLATGAWRDPARLKMGSAGLDFDEYPSATCDDAPDRESIIKLSMERSVRRYGAAQSVVYIGDGVWDGRACRAIGIPFIGIASAADAPRLMAEGAVRTFPDLADSNSILKRF